MKVSLMLAAVLILTCFSANTAFAEESVPEPAGTPKIRLSSDSTLEITQGEKKEFTIELKNVGSGHAYNLFVQATPEPTDPFTVSLEIIGGSQTVQSGAAKQVKLTVNAEKGAAQKVYPITLSFNYVNNYKEPFENTDKLNIKMNNPYVESEIKTYDFSLKPEQIKAGETAELSFSYMNIGSVAEDYLKIALDGLDTSTITVSGGTSSKTFTNVRAHYEEKISFLINAAKDCKSGTYPIKIVTTIRDGAGQNVTSEETYYVTVIGSDDEDDSEDDAIIDVINTSTPTGTYGVGQPFSISFDIKNNSFYSAKNLLVKADAKDGFEIVPTSQSIIQTRELKPGETKRHNFTFAATSSAETQNYPISFTIEYDSNTTKIDAEKTKISFNHFFGVNISNPEKDKEEEEKDDEDESKKNIPKIIVSSYKSSPTIVKAGGEFELSMTFMNSHAQKPVKNIKVYLTVTDKDDNQGASIFSPVGASNTLYIDQIAPKQTVTRSINYYTIPDAQPQNYSINVNLEYEDETGEAITSEEIVGINVSQPPVVETTEINIPDYAESGMPVFISFDIFNTGKVTVNNLKVMIEGDVQTDNKTTFIGNLEAGSQEMYEAQIIPTMPGELTGTIILSYDSATGEHFEIPSDFTINVSEPPPPEMMEPEMPLEEGQGADSVKTKIIAGVAVAALGIGFVAYKGYKKKQKGNDFDE